MNVIDLLNQNTYGTTKSIQPPMSQANSMPAQPVYGHIGPPEEYGEAIRQNGWHNGASNHINGMEQNGAMHINNHQMPPMHHQMIPPEHLGLNNHIQANHSSSMLQQQQMNNVPPAVSQPTYMSSTHLQMHRNSVSNVSQPVPMQPLPPMGAPQAPPQNIPPPPPPPPSSNGPMMAPNVNNGNGTINGNMSGAPAPVSNIPPPPPPPMPNLLNGAPRIPPVNGPNGNAPPAPPPAPPATQNNGPSGLAAAIANAKLKRTTSVKEDNDSLSSNSSAGRTPAPGNLMDEMAKTLARRRAQAESNQSQPNENEGSRFNGFNSNKEKTSLVNGFSPSKDESNSHQRFVLLRFKVDSFH